MLIDANGKKQGIMQIEKALDKANKDNLDLVQVSPNDSDPIVCKLLDYGKYIFDKNLFRFLHLNHEEGDIIQKKYD